MITEVPILATHFLSIFSWIDGYRTFYVLFDLTLCCICSSCVPTDLWIAILLIVCPILGLLHNSFPSVTLPHDFIRVHIQGIY